jgi:EAL domain-containing protein (putative c-di-GMP-specific phosphodiesterase class I)
MLCAVSDVATPSLNERDLAAVGLLAELLRDLQSRALSASDAVLERDHLRQAVVEVISGAGRHPVLQPVVDLTTGRAVAAEGLTRFTVPSPAGPGRSTAQWFDDAARLGLRQELEVATAAAVLDLLAHPGVPDGTAVTINLGPATITSPAFVQLMVGRVLDRIVVEVTEHAPVDDYGALAAVLRPYRDAGLRLAVDDCGAGYASLQHVLAVQPDLLKVDMALTRGVDADPARQTLLRALAGFAEPTGCQLVCEGVETAAELLAVHDCGVRLAQGYFLARPSAAPAWSGYPSVTPGDQLAFDAH